VRCGLTEGKACIPQKYLFGKNYRTYSLKHLCYLFLSIPDGDAVECIFIDGLEDGGRSLEVEYIETVVKSLSRRLSLLLLHYNLKI
jgi:hypothetical protein